MRGTPDGEFKWICHIRDHFSKYSVATPMKSKASEEVASVFLTWIIHLGVPGKVHCDNGTEFKGALELLLRKHGIKIIHGRAHHPQSQGMVEKGNDILKEKIAAWLSDHQSSSWVEAIPEALIAMNIQRSSVTKKSPYEIVFGKRANLSFTSGLEREHMAVPEESSDDGETSSNTAGLI